MPIRTNSIAVSSKGHGGSTAQSRASNNSRNEDWDSGGTNPSQAPVVERPTAAHDITGLTKREPAADRPAQKLQQKSPSTSSMSTSTRRSNATPSNEPVYNAPSKKTPMFSSRRRQSSIPNAKAPQGPRPLDAPANKR